MLPVVICAGGPSVTLTDVRLIGMARSANKCRVHAVNDAVYPCWFADHVHAADRRWWDENNGLPYFFGWKTSVEETKFQDVVSLTNTGPEGYERRFGAVRTGGNSGYQAVQIAAQAGAEDIILVGFDFSDGGARDHWFGRHKYGMDRSSHVADWRRVFRQLTDELSDCHIRVWNAGSLSTIDWLPKTSIETFFSI